jgi:uncharacterized protein YacL
MKPLGQDVQSYSALLVLLFAIMIQIHVKPYVLPSMNFAEFFGLLTNFMTTFLGLYLASENITSILAHTAFASIILIMNAIFLLYIFYYLCLASTKTITNRIFRRKGESSLTKDSRVQDPSMLKVAVASSEVFGNAHGREESHMEYTMDELQKERAKVQQG